MAERKDKITERKDEMTGRKDEMAERKYKTTHVKMFLHNVNTKWPHVIIKPQQVI